MLQNNETCRLLINSRIVESLSTAVPADEVPLRDHADHADQDTALVCMLKSTLPVSKGPTCYSLTGRSDHNGFLESKLQQRLVGLHELSLSVQT